MDGMATTPKARKTKGWQIALVIAAVIGMLLGTYYLVTSLRYKQNKLVEKLDLKYAGLAYLNCSDANGFPPQKAQDFIDFLESSHSSIEDTESRLIELVNSGKLKVNWGIGHQDEDYYSSPNELAPRDPNDTSDALLMSMPILGNPERLWVVKLDGTVNEMTPQEAQILPKGLLVTKRRSKPIHEKYERLAKRFHFYYGATEDTRLSVKNKHQVLEFIDLNGSMDDLDLQLIEYLKNDRLKVNWGVLVSHMHPGRDKSKKRLMYIKLTEPEGEGEVLVQDLSGTVNFAVAEKFKEGF
jgi:hypothetical protein